MSQSVSQSASQFVSIYYSFMLQHVRCLPLVLFFFCFFSVSYLSLSIPPVFFLFLVLSLLFILVASIFQFITLLFWFPILWRVCRVCVCIVCYIAFAASSSNKRSLAFSVNRLFSFPHSSKFCSLFQDYS